MIRNSVFAFCVLVVFAVGVVPALNAQEGRRVRKRDVSPDVVIPDVKIERESIQALFGMFSFQYMIPLGLEVAHGGDESIFYELDFKQGSLSDLMTKFVAEHKEYTWTIEDGILSIFPKDDYRDPVLKQLLTSEIKNFSLEKKTGVWTFGENLLNTPEAKRILEPYRLTYDTGYMGGFYIQQLGREFSFDVSNVRLKSILDRVIKESPVARYWIINNNLTERKLYLRVNVIPEYPRNN